MFKIAWVASSVIAAPPTKPAASSSHPTDACAIERPSFCAKVIVALISAAAPAPSYQLVQSTHSGIQDVIAGVKNAPPIRLRSISTTTKSAERLSPPIKIATGRASLMQFFFAKSLFLRTFLKNVKIIFKSS